MADYTPLNLADGQTFKAEHVAHVETGVQDARTHAEDLDTANRSAWAAADSQVLADAQGYTDGKAFLRDPLASGVDFDTVTTTGQYPVTASNHPNQPFAVGGYLTVESNGSSRRLQRFTTNEPTPRYAERVTALSGWNPWRIPRDAAVNAAKAYTDEQITPDFGAPLEHDFRLADMRERLGKVEISAPKAVTLVMDHGLTNFAATVWPLLEARGLPVTLALNSERWTDANNSGATAEDVKTWMSTGLLEPANHGRAHSLTGDEQADYDEIVGGRTDLETQLSATIDTWVQTGNGAYPFGDGDSLEAYWTTTTGPIAYRSHAVGTGLLPNEGSSYYDLDGQPVFGVKGGWIDGGAGPVQTAIENMPEGMGYVVRFHPQYLDATDKITTAALTDFLDWLKAEVDAGRLAVLTFREWQIAEADPVAAAKAYTDEQAAALESRVGDLESTSDSGMKIAPAAISLPGASQSQTAERGTVRYVRRFAVAPQRVRVHVRNSNPFGSTATPTHASQIYVGRGDSAGGFTNSTMVADQAVIPGDGTELVTEWATLDLADGDYLGVSIGWVGQDGSTSTQQMMRAGAWTHTDNMVVNYTNTTNWTRVTTAPFYVWIEAEIPASTPVVAALGDSITVGTGADDPVGDSWAALYAYDQGSWPLLMAQHGSTMNSWLYDHAARWDVLYPGIDLPLIVDAVVNQLGRNDITDTATLAELQDEANRLVPIISRRLGGPMYYGTVTPYHAETASKFDVRTAYNDWIRTRPNGVRGIIDFAEVIGTADDTAIQDQYSADGLHPNTAGYRAMADELLARPVSPFTLAPDTLKALAGLVA